MKIQNLTPIFEFGHSSESHCDCLGLVIIFLKDQGFLCEWEQEINRYYSKYDQVIQSLEKYNFEEIENSKIPCIALIKTKENDGHLGIYLPDENKIYSMSIHGILIEHKKHQRLFNYVGK
jgi:hypothetical protein